MDQGTQVCQNRVGQNVVTFPCQLGLPVGHPGPCQAGEIPRSIRQRKAWEEEQRNLEVMRSMQGPAETFRERHYDNDINTEHDELKDIADSVNVGYIKVIDEVRFDDPEFDGQHFRAPEPHPEFRKGPAQAEAAQLPTCFACQHGMHKDCIFLHDLTQLQNLYDAEELNGFIPAKCACFQVDPMAHLKVIGGEIQTNEDAEFYEEDESPPPTFSVADGVTEPPKGILIGLCGLPRSGKSTVAQFLADFYSFNQWTFGEKLYEWAYAINPVVSVRDDGMTRYDGSYVYLQDIVDRQGWTEAKTNPQVRRILQRIGTELGRNIIHEDLWSNFVFGSMDPNERNVIADVRPAFPRDIERIRELGGFLIKIERPGIKAPNDHMAETGLDTIDYDDYIDNDGTLHTLMLKTKAVLGEILLARL